MQERRAHLRTAKMVRIETAWKDESGASHTSAAMIEDSSLGGVGIRIKAQVSVGTKIEIKSHREHFSGIVMNCHRIGTEYFIGIKRDKVEVLVSK
jgi:hypothetical protein